MDINVKNTKLAINETAWRHFYQDFQAVAWYNPGSLLENGEGLWDKDNYSELEMNQI